MHMQIEFTNICNLRCVECPQRMLQRPHGKMSDEVFDKLLHEYIIRFQPNTIICHKDGEPLLHEKLPEFLDTMDNAVLTKFDIYTNGLLLKPDFVEKLGLLRSKVWLLVSFHFFDENGKFVEKYEEAEDRIEQSIKAAPRNVDFIFASHVTDYADKEVLEGWKQHWVSKNLPRLTAVHVNTAINPWLGLIKQKNAIEFHDCPYTDGQHMFFGVTGNVIVCCMDLEEEIVFGNIMTDDPNTILSRRGQFYQDLRDQKIERHVCKRCLGGRKLL